MVGATVGAGPRPRGRRSATIEEFIEALRRIAGARGRDDLVARLDVAGWRAARTETLVCAVGEFKKGKSALLNALVGREACPSDDDRATAAVTLLRQSKRPEVTVRRRSEGGIAVEAADPDRIARLLLEDAGRSEPSDVVLVEMGLPSPFLERGVTLVDTPGVGGLNAAHAVATLAFLPLADALVFVTDASAELTGSEIEFLSRAAAAGPPIIVAVTKIDMVPEWRRIVALDEEHLRAAGLPLEVIPVSATLCGVGGVGDPSLSEASGVPALAAAILATTGGGARRRAAAGAAADLWPVIAELRTPLVSECVALEDPSRASDVAARLAAARDRLTTMAAADARWAERLDAEFERLRTGVRFHVETGLRHELRAAHEEIERVDPAQTWSDLSRRFQERVATVVQGAIAEARDGADGIVETISAMIGDAQGGLSGTDDASERIDMADLWCGSPAFGARSRAGMLGTIGLFAGAGVFGAHLGTVGIEMAGLLGTLFGAAIVGPAVVGSALVIGGKRITDERRRQLGDRRQEARAFLDRFVDDVRFEVDGRLETLLRDLRHRLRTHVADRIRRLRQATEEGVRALEHAVVQDAADRDGRIAALRVRIAELDELGARLQALPSAGRRG